MLWIIYNLLFPLAFLLMLPKFISRMLRRGGYKRHFEQRFGIYGSGTTARLAKGPRIWVHAVSVGEFFVALRFMEEYRKAHPEALFVLSTNTSTGHKLANEKLDPRDVLIYFPLDFPFVIRRVLDALNPQKLILVECELWPNLIRQAHRRGIPVSLINGRISDSSFKGYMLLRPFTRGILELIDPLCMQGRQDAERMIEMGARPETVKTLGTAKYDQAVSDVGVGGRARAVLRQVSVPDDALILLGGSTWPGEEKALCSIYKKLKATHADLFLVLVPRHFERRDEVVQDIQSEGLALVLKSGLSGEVAKPDVLVVDTTGELMGFYAAANLVFVGKSLCEHGGQNPIEPALFGKPIVVGPNMENFPSVMDDFLAGKGLRQVADVAELETVLTDLLADADARKALGNAAAEVIEAHRGVVGKMVEAVG